MKIDYEYLPLSKIKVDIRNPLCYSQNYAHAVHGKRAIDAVSVNTPAGTTVLPSIRLKGSLIYTTHQGGRTAPRSHEYMGKQLMPSLENEDVAIMDDMRSHHAKIVTKSVSRETWLNKRQLFQTQISILLF